jgi:DNA-binding transcriptional LysR family regulator
MDRLLAMETLVRVADSGSFSAAAKQLGVSVSAVAKTVARLETRLGVQLVARSTRRVALSDDGREFCARAREILAEVESAETAAQPGAGAVRGRVRLVLPVLFGRLAFLPRMAEFATRHPQVLVDLRLDDRPGDLIESGLDLAVVVGDLSDSRYVARVLSRGPRITAASPTYLARHGRPRVPADLARHNCVVSGSSPEWPFLVDGRLERVAVSGNPVVQGGEAMRECALLGLGLVQSNWWTLQQDVAAGRLQAVLDDYAVEGLPVNVVYLSSRLVPRRVRAMVEFLVEIARVPQPPAPRRAALPRARRR